MREVSLREELEQSEGTITFGSGVQEQDLIIRLRNDNVGTVKSEVNLREDLNRITYLWLLIAGYL